MEHTLPQTKEQLAAYFDHTCLQPQADESRMALLCQEARTIHAAMVAINPVWTRFCKEQLKGSPVHVGAAVSFPLGQCELESKLDQTKLAIRHGADEIDYVLHIGKVKMKDWAYIEQEMQMIVDACKANHVVSKVILETCLLSEDEIRKICQIACKVQPDFVKTSTGFSQKGAEAKIVKMMKDEVGDLVQVKAAGGIRSWAECKEMIEAGATRIGTSSSLKILEEFVQDQQNR